MSNIHHRKRGRRGHKHYQHDERVERYKHIKTSAVAKRLRRA